MPEMNLAAAEAGLAETVQARGKLAAGEEGFDFADLGDDFVAGHELGRNFGFLFQR